MGFDFEIPEDNEGKVSNTDNAPSFGNDMTPSKFREACTKYAEWCIENYDEFDEVTLEGVPVEVSKKLKRTAGKAGHKPKADEQFLRFAVGAYEEWGWGEEVEQTIRHELIHLQDYQTKGDSGHGWAFKQVAGKVDAPIHCKQFTDFNYGVYCGDCDELVAGRYRSCKMTKNPGQYRSKCCSAKCYSEKL